MIQYAKKYNVSAFEQPFSIGIVCIITYLLFGIQLISFDKSKGTPVDEWKNVLKQCLDVGIDVYADE
jgi:hypothetical protein